MLPEGSVPRCNWGYYGILCAVEKQADCKRVLGPHAVSWELYYDDYFIVRLKEETLEESLHLIENHCIYDSPLRWNRRLVWVGEQIQENSDEGSRVD